MLVRDRVGGGRDSFHTTLPKNQRNVDVAHEYTSIRGLFEDVPGFDRVFYFVFLAARRSVGIEDAVFDDLLRQGAQVVFDIPGEGGVRPLVVIAPHGRQRPVPEELHDLGSVGTAVDQIAQAENAVTPHPGDVVEDRLQSVVVAVNIRDQRRSHRFFLSTL